MPVVKSHTALDNRKASINKTKFLKETIKQVLWQTFINDQRPKQKRWINDILIEGLLETGPDVTIISLKFWHPDWPLGSSSF